MFSASGDHLEGKRISERYRIKRVEKWTEHTVFCVAEDMSDSRLYDLLLIDSSVINDLAGMKKQVAKKLRLRHKSLSALLASGSTSEGEEFFVTEKCEPTLLSSLLSKCQLSVRQSSDLLIELIEGLDYLSKAGEQPFLPFPQLITVDSFGAQIHAKLPVLNFSEDLLPADTCSQVEITPIERARFTPPECFKGAKIDQRSQIYALACLLYQMLSGQSPFDSDDLVELESQQLCVRPGRLHEKRPDLYIDPRIEDVLIKALQKQPEKRQSSLSEFKEELQDALCENKFWNSRSRKLSGIAATVVLAVSAICLSGQFGIGQSSAVSDPAPIAAIDPAPEPAQKNELLATLPDVPASANKLGELILTGDQKRELDAGDYVCSRLHVSGNARLSAKGTVHLWVDAPDDGERAIEMKDNAIIAAVKNSDDFTIYDMNTASIKMRDRAKINASVLAPAALLEAQDEAQIQGSFTSNGQKLDGKARFINSSSDE